MSSTDLLQAKLFFGTLLANMESITWKTWVIVAVGNFFFDF